MSNEILEVINMATKKGCDIRFYPKKRMETINGWWHTILVTDEDFKGHAVRDQTLRQCAIKMLKFLAKKK